MSKFGKKPIAIPRVSDLPTAFWKGIAQFNQGEFYTCHDTLEALWMEAAEPNRTFFQGVLQIAVALYHLQHQNQRGAVLLLGEGSRRLSAYVPSYGGLDVESLLSQAQALLANLQAATDSSDLARIQIKIQS